MERRVINLGGLTVRYYAAGEGPPLLLIHGAGATARLWHRQVGPLSKKFRVIAPDLPGFGGSDRFPDIKKVRDYAGFLARFMGALGIDRASVAASSMGGWAACWLAADYPGKVDRLVLIAPAGLYFADEPPMPVSQVVDEVERYYSGLLAAEGLVGSRPSDEMKKAIGTITSLDGLGGFTPDAAAALPNIKAGTLIIWGSEDRVVPVSYADEFKDCISGSVLKVLTGAGHLPFVERPEEVNALTISFLG